MKNCIRALMIAVCTMVLYSCGTPAHFPLSFPNSKDADDRIVGNWKLVEDTNKNNFYEITKRDGADFTYHIRFFNRGGSNPTYESNIFFSQMWRSGIKFINVPHFTESKGDQMGWKDNGYFFLRILEANEDFSKITTATVNDPVLPTLKSAKELSEYMMANLDNARIYSDTVHFYKVKLSTSAMRQK